MGGAIRGGRARRAARGLWGRAEAAILLACLALVACFASGATAAAAELTRPDYVSQLETICKPDAEATQRANNYEPVANCFELAAFPRAPAKKC